MRLIDADKLIERIYEYQSKSIDTDDIIHSIKTLQTAYDVEAVTTELEKHMKASEKDYALFQFSVAMGEMRAFEKAIEIVRGKE